MGILSEEKAGDYLLPFGKYKGLSLREIFDENPGYLDWLGSQDWVFKPTMRIIRKFLSIGYVRREIDRRYFDTDPMTGNSYTTYQAFIPSEQTSKEVTCEETYCISYYPTERSRKLRHKLGRREVKRSSFLFGKASWLKIEYGPKRPLPWKPSKAMQAKIARGTHLPNDPNEEKRRWRAAGPQEPARDWQPVPMTAGDAWSIAADLLLAIEQAEFVEEVEYIEKEERLDQLSKHLPAAAMKKLREAYVAKRDQMALIALLPDWKRRDALLALDAIKDEPQLEEVLKQEAPELHDAVELIRLS